MYLIQIKNILQQIIIYIFNLKNRIVNNMNSI